MCYHESYSGLVIRRHLSRQSAGASYNGSIVRSSSETTREDEQNTKRNEYALSKCKHGPARFLVSGLIDADGHIGLEFSDKKPKLYRV